MAKFDAGRRADIGYHADYGGRIELIQQGYDETGVVYKNDERSSYPHKCVPIPSMIGGLWEKREDGKFDWADIENSSVLSMFRIKWALPERYVDAGDVLRTAPFYALPYRLEGGGIRFFSEGIWMVSPR